MPKTQVAAVSNYDVNAPVAVAAAGKVEVLRLRQRYARGANLRFGFEPVSQFGGADEEAESDVEVSVQVSANGTSWSATTASNNGAAVTDEAIVRLSSTDFQVRLRAGVDLYCRVIARSTGLKASRLHIQVRGNEDVDVVSEGQDLRAKGPTGV